MHRCYKQDEFGEVESAQLHHFCDASTVGYGQCSYLRLVDLNEKVRCSLYRQVQDSSDKTGYNPKLELSAAVLSVRISNFLRRELKYKNKEYFWTDSTVVLGYINSNAKRFYIFVANRIQQIRAYSNPDQWRYIS